MSQTVGISMMKDESDICYWTVKHMMTQVDTVLIFDNNSEDDTAHLCRNAGAIVLPDPDPAYYQSIKMTKLARIAKLEYNADWIIPFDADEIWFSPKGKIKDALASLDPSFMVTSVLLYNHFSTGKDLDGYNPFKKMVWKHIKPGALPKVACRWSDDLAIAQGNHGAIYNGQVDMIANILELRHFPYRSPEQFVRKVKNGAKAYELAVDLDENVGAHWKDYGRILNEKGEDELINEVYFKWFFFDDPEGHPDFILDPAPAIC